MENDPIHDEEKSGLTINIYQDPDSRSPDEDQDNNLFLVGYHRDFYVDQNKLVSKDLAHAIMNKGLDQYNEPWEAALDMIERYHIFGLKAYIHSDVRLALSNEGRFPDRAWDVSQLGLVFVSKEEWPDQEKARKAALGHINYWNDYLSGNVYGYVIENAAGDHFDSCWGFYGDYEYCLQEARAALEGIISEAAKIMPQLVF